MHLSPAASLRQSTRPLYFSATPVRYFSAASSSDGSSASAGAAEAKADDSIFASADYFKDVKPDEVAEADTSAVDSVTPDGANQVNELLYSDANDSLFTSMAFQAKDWDNLVQGVSTYGFSETIVYYETVLYDLWMFFAETQGMGMGPGVVAAALVSRAVFGPLAVYAVSKELANKKINVDCIVLKES